MPPCNDAVLRRPVIPVLTIERVADAVPLARALVEGGLDVLEVTLRTGAALDAIAAIRTAVPSALVGAGTVNDEPAFAAAVAAGARFVVSPGATPALLEAAADSALPWLPGAATVSEVMVLADAGFGVQKLFPAEPLGGPAFLDAIRGPVPEVTFCPTGGVNGANATRYLACANVACVGGSWVAPRAALAAGDWAAVTAAARVASALERAWAPARR